jgi:hypothetical protein
MTGHHVEESESKAVWIACEFYAPPAGQASEVEFVAGSSEQTR